LLRLQKIYMQGFKSFADKTELTFKGEGITAIVGPNGCGKSNISDAIAWVLGEQSPKLLRGGRMEDVIFNGTRMRLPVGLAEVALTFVDPEVLREAGYPIQPRAVESETRQELPEPAPLPAEGEVAEDLETEPSVTAEAASSLETGVAVAVRRRRRPKVQTAPGELVISRRLFRSGDSEYLINGRQVRLRDIQDIFMGTGLGPDSYAIIEQGRVGMILSSKPSDRRAIIEEAAGITKFKSKRKLAESRLEQAKQNLLRVNDIAEEVSKQLNSLKRQAARARRYGDLREKMRDVTRRLFVARELTLQSLIEQNDRQLREIAQYYQRQHQEIQDKETAYRQNNLFQLHIDEQLKQVREQLAQLNLEMERAQQRVQFQREQWRELESRSQENSQEIGHLRQQELIYLEELEQKQEALLEVNERFSRANSEFQSQDSFSQGLQTRIQELESSEDRARTQLLDSVGRTAALCNQLVQLDELEKRSQQQISRLEAEKTETMSSRVTISVELETARQQLEQQAKRLAELRESGTTLAQRLSELKTEESAATEKLTDRKEKFSAGSHRLESLKDLAIHHAYSAEAVRILLSASEDSGEDGFRTSGILADLVEVEPPHEATVEDFLRQELEYLLVEGPAAAINGIALLRKKGAGKSTFLLCGNSEKKELHQWRDEAARLAQEVPVAVPLAAVVKFPESIWAIAQEALPHLLQAFIVPDCQRALDLAQDYPQLIFLTPDGETVRGRLISGGGRTSGGHLSLKREIRELQRKVESLRKEIGVKEEEVQILRHSVQSVEQELNDVRDQAQEVEKVLVGSDLQVKQLDSELERLARRENLARLELQRIEDERIQLQLQRVEHEKEIDAAESAKAEIEDLIAKQQNSLKQLKEQASQDSQTLSELRSDLATFRERKLSAENELSRLTGSLKECQDRISRLESQKTSWFQQIEEIAESSRRIEEESFKQSVQKASLEAEIRSRENELTETRVCQSNLEQELQQLRTNLETTQDQKTQLEISRAKLDSDFGHLQEACLSELGVSLMEIRPKETIRPSAEDYHQLEQEYQDLRNRIEGIGPVNMMALEEYQECEQRFKFLSTQRQDLLDSIEDTNAAIKEIDQVSREQFREAFKAINAYFQESFKDLFGGGHGEMKLLDEQDELESGIEIIAQPPGKRLQNVLLLSGGEKALTAVALLLAIFRYQPSPFCVLDEVDAPLDEVNISRFSQIIKLMSAGTQFVVITHNRRTMEVADTLYGVTMQEAGVSKLVSVQFD
jgi:chromosome segregation protein